MVTAFYGITNTADFFAGVFMLRRTTTGDRRIAFTGAIGLACFTVDTYVTIIAVFSFIDGVITDTIGACPLIKAAVTLVLITKDGVTADTAAA